MGGPLTRLFKDNLSHSLLLPSGFRLTLFQKGKHFIKKAKSTLTSANQNL